MSRAQWRDAMVEDLLTLMKHWGITFTHRQESDVRAEIDRVLWKYGDRIESYDPRVRE